ncbi:MAG TPA: universal stress protein, partial [Gaiella sp.]|nr:universal stress protein [Gaiella sp.]
LPRPFRAGPDVKVGGHRLPLPALIGAPLTAAIFVIALGTHHGALVAGPIWLLLGLGVYAATRVRQRRGMLEDVDPRAAPAGSSFSRVLVPMKLGDIGEEMVATAIALAKDHDATVEAITVVKVPRERALDDPLPDDLAERAEASVAEARALGEENGVEVVSEAVRARSIAHAIVEEAERRQVDLIVLGSSPRWRRQSRFFSPTVDHVLKHATCEVLVVAFPEGVFEEA